MSDIEANLVEPYAYAYEHEGTEYDEFCLPPIVPAANRRRIAGEPWTEIALYAASTRPGLVAPDGWFLYRAAHEHTGIHYHGDTHTPLPHKDGPWCVGFQRYPDGGLLTEARGRSLEGAWSNAAAAVAARMEDYSA